MVKNNDHPANFDSLRFLSETAMAFTTSSISDSIYEYICQSLKKLNPDSIILVNSLDHERGLSVNKAIDVGSRRMERIIELLRFNPKGKTYKFDDTIYQLLTGSITKAKGGLHELSFNNIPKSLAYVAEKALDIGDIYGIAFIVDQKMYAVAAVLLRKGHELRHPETLETFVRQASVTLKRIEAEKREAEHRAISRLLAESEANARAIMESTQNVIILIDKDFRVIDNNDAHARRFGMKREEMIGKTLMDFLPPEIAEPRKKYIELVLNSGKPSFFEDERGGYWNEISIYPVIDINGVIDRVAVFVQDITDRKNKEEALKHSTAELHQHIATKDKFFSIIAHDLRNPFNNILGFSSMIMEDASTMDISQIEKSASVIHESAKKTLQLLDNLLNWARMQQNQMSFVPKKLLLHEMAEASINVIQDQAAKKNISLHNKVPQNLITRADQDMLQAILRNLVSNAVKFTEPGGLVEISSENINNETNVFIKDDGIGISPENITKLFDVTTNYSQRGTANEKGTGIGLLLCKDFVERHGGRIWVESETGKGTTIGFTLPTE